MGYLEGPDGNPDTRFLYYVFGGLLFGLGLIFNALEFQIYIVRTLLVLSIVLIMIGIVTDPQKFEYGGKVFSNLAVIISSILVLIALFIPQSTEEVTTGFGRYFTYQDTCIVLSIMIFISHFFISQQTQLMMKMGFVTHFTSIVLIGVAMITSIGAFLSKTGTNKKTMYIVISVLSTIASVVLYFIYPMSISNVIRDYSMDLNFKESIDASLFPQPKMTGGLGITYNFCLFLAPVQPKYGKMVNILSRKNQIQVLYNPKYSELYINIPTKKTVSSYAENVIRIPDFPLQAWTSIGIAINQRRVSVYINGRPHSTMDLENTAIVSNYSVEIGHTDAFDGDSLINMIRYFPYRLEDAEIEYIGWEDRRIAMGVTGPQMLF